MGEFVLCSNCRSVFLDVDFEKHKCMKDEGNGLVAISEKGRHPIDFKAEDFENLSQQKR